MQIHLKPFYRFYVYVFYIFTTSSLFHAAILTLRLDFRTEILLIPGESYSPARYTL